MISTKVNNGQLRLSAQNQNEPFARQFRDTCSSSSYPDVEPQWSGCHGGSLTIPEPEDLLTENLSVAAVFMRLIYTLYAGASSGLTVVKFRRLYLAAEAVSLSENDGLKIQNATIPNVFFFFFTPSP